MVLSGLMVLWVACSNVTTILLARAISRQQAMAVRAALGATRSRLFALVLTESLILAVLGGIIGVATAQLYVSGLSHWLPVGNMPAWLVPTLDWRVAGFSFGASLLTLLWIGLAPALISSNVDLTQPLKAGGSHTASLKHLRAGRFLVILEIASAFVVLVGSVLIFQSFQRLRGLDPGLDATHVLVASTFLSKSQYPDRAAQDQYLTAATERLAESMGRTSVALRATAVPDDSSNSDVRRSSLDLSNAFLVSALGGATPPHARSFERSVTRYAVTEHFFRVTGLRLVDGRGFTSSDDASSSPVAVISAQVAQTYWPGERALGRQLRLGANGKWMTVVGIVPDVHAPRLSSGSVIGTVEASIYVPWKQSSVVGPEFFVRFDGDVAAASQDLAMRLRAIDPNQPILGVLPLSEVLGRGTTMLRQLSWILATIAAGAVLLTVIGVNGVVRYSVNRQVRELGIRLALGASPAGLRNKVLRDALRLVAYGLAWGAVGAIAVSRMVGAFVPGIFANSITGLVAGAVLLVVVTIIAAAQPAARAAQVDPVFAFRD
jgi:putative ABC transport system permease protein